MRTPTPTALDRQQRYEKKRYANPVQREKKAAYLKLWRASHPEAKQKENRLRKERMGGHSRNFTKAERELLEEKQLGICGLCGNDLDQYEDRATRIEVDHIIPLCLGGDHSLENAHLVHASCNRAKGRKLYA